MSVMRRHTKLRFLTMLTASEVDCIMPKRVSMDFKFADNCNVDERIMKKDL